MSDRAASMGGMRMSNLFDDISRIIAKPMPRRQAFKLVGGAVGGAALAALGLERVSRAFGEPGGRPGSPFDNCPSGQTVCGTTSSGKLRCCQTGQTCCNNANCCASNEHCCGTKCCQPAQACCNVSGKLVCCTSGPSPQNSCVGATKCG